MIIETPKGKRHEHILKLMFKASNNKAKYEALIGGIELCHIARVDLVKAYSDS